MFSVTFARSARKELEALPVSFKLKILEKIEQLGYEPYPHGCKKIKGTMQSYRIRIGDYRVIYDIDGKKKIIDIVVIRHRQSAYK